MERIERRVVSDFTNTWRLITIFGALIGVVAVGVYGFQQRTPIFEALTGHKIFMRAPLKTPYPGQETSIVLQKFADARDTVLGITVSKTDFEQNTRTATYHYFKKEDVQDSWKAVDGTSRELFGEDETLNARVVALINGQFVCSDTSETLAAKVHPIMLKYSKTTCSVAVPPGYGDFLGWVNFYLTETPTFAQLQSLERQAKQISREMYERDILKK